MIFSAFASGQAESFVAPLPAGYHGRVGAPNPRSGKHVGCNEKKHGQHGCLGWEYGIPIWVFPKIGVPQNGWFIVEDPIEMDDLGLGVALFLETPIYVD